MAYGSSSDYINGVDQRTRAQKDRAIKEQEAKDKAELARRAEIAKQHKAKKQDEAMSGKNAPKSPSPSDIQTGHFRTTKYTKPIK